MKNEECSPDLLNPPLLVPPGVAVPEGVDVISVDVLAPPPPEAVHHDQHVVVALPILKEGWNDAAFAGHWCVPPGNVST